MEELGTSVEAVGVVSGHAPVTRGATTRVCLLSIGGTEMAMELQYVREVFIVTTITQVPGSSSGLSGVTPLRGVVMPLTDLRPLIGLPQTGPIPKYAMVIHTGGRQFSILTEKVPEILTVRVEDFMPAPGIDNDAENALFPRALKIGERYFNLAEPSAILAAIER